MFLEDLLVVTDATRAIVEDSEKLAAMKRRDRRAAKEGAVFVRKDLLLTYADLSAPDEDLPDRDDD